MRTHIQKSTLTLPVTALLPENPLPRFADPKDRPLRDGGLLPEEKEGFAKDTGFRVLPYRMQDRNEPIAKETTIPTVVLENSRLRATFLPGYGGRLHSLWDKKNNRECLYSNSEIILRNLALRNAWFSGGIEWNFGHFGHTFFTCQEVFFAACTDENGEAFLRMYEFERCKQVTFQVDFHLPQEADALTAHLCLYNRLPTDAPIFLWTNTAIVEEPGMHVYSGTREAVGQHIHINPAESYFYHGQLPELCYPGIDGSDPTQFKMSTEYFFQNPPTLEASFEAARYPDGRLFAERSTSNLPYRKVFCWGTHTGGQHWQEFLAGQGAGEYVEVQAGISRTQVHPATLPAHSALRITQQFTFADAPAPTGDYGQARAQIQATVEKLLPIQALLAMDRRCQALSQKAADEILYEGLGWGALERRRDAAALPPHLSFPDSTLSLQQQPWLELLRGKAMESCDSFMVSDAWVARMEAVAEKSAALWNLLGVAYLENGRLQEAQSAWEASLRLKGTPMAHRNLACLLWRQGNPSAALSQRQSAAGLLTDAEALRPYAIELITLLTEMGQFAEAFAYYRSLPQSLQAEERVRLTVMKSAYEQEEDAFLQALFATEFTVVKEGETQVYDLWFLQEAKTRAKQLGLPLTEDFLQQIKATVPLPRHLDFSQYNFSTP